MGCAVVVEKEELKVNYYYYCKKKNLNSGITNFISFSLDESEIKKKEQDICSLEALIA